MNIVVINFVLSGLVEQLAGDQNDPDEFGMDVHTKKRLKVKRKFSKMKNKPMKEPPSVLPYSLANI